MNVRILHIIGDSKFGGASQSILRLGRFWQSQGWEVEVLATDSQFCDYASSLGVPVVPLDVIWRDIRPWRDLCGLVRLYRFLKHTDYTVVHTHTTKAGFIGRLAASMARVPIVLHTAHGFAFHEQSAWWRIAFYVALERLASVGCRRVIAVSRFHEAWGRRLGIAAGKKITAIPNGIPQPPESDPAAREIVRNSWGVAHGETVLLSPGRLAPEKGLEDLIEAFALLCRRPGAKYRLVFAGDGPLRASLESMVRSGGMRDYVEFLGFHPDVPSLLPAADMIVLPTWREGLSIALLEAMSCGCAIITTTIGSNREATGEGRGALLVSPRQPAQLAGAIERLAASHEFRQALGERARSIFLENHTLDRMMAQYKQTYVELLKEVDDAESLSPVLSSVDR